MHRDPAEITSDLSQEHKNRLQLTAMRNYCGAGWDEKAVGGPDQVVAAVVLRLLFLYTVRAGEPIGPASIGLEYLLGYSITAMLVYQASSKSDPAVHVLSFLQPYLKSHDSIADRFVLAIVHAIVDVYSIMGKDLSR